MADTNPNETGDMESTAIDEETTAMGETRIHAQRLNISPVSTAEEIETAFRIMSYNPSATDEDRREWSISKHYLILHAPSAEERPTNYLIAGNPGVGKSSLLNGLIGECKFKAGVSYAHGMTYQMDMYSDPPHTFLDTPGLSDVTMREKAAESITQALQQGGAFKIVFVVSLESGRLRPQDIATIRVILNAAPIGEKYGIIVNKVSQKLVKDILENPKNKSPSPQEVLLAEFFAGVPLPTSHFTCLASDEVMEDEEDKLMTLPDHFRTWIGNLPVVDIDPESVSAVRVEDFEQLEQNFEELRQDQDELMRQLQIRESEMIQIQAELRRAYQHGFDIEVPSELCEGKAKSRCSIL